MFNHIRLGTSTNGDDALDDLAGPTLDTALALGAPMARIWTEFGVMPDSPADDRARVVDRTRRLVRAAAERNLVLALEFHPFTHTHTTAGALDLFDAVDDGALRTTGDPTRPFPSPMRWPSSNWWPTVSPTSTCSPGVQRDRGTSSACGRCRPLARRDHPGPVRSTAAQDRPPLRPLRVRGRRRSGRPGRSPSSDAMRATGPLRRLRQPRCGLGLVERGEQSVEVVGRCDGRGRRRDDLVYPLDCHTDHERRHRYPSSRCRLLEALVRFHEALSADAQRSRFFAAHPHLTGAEVAFVTGEDYRGRGPASQLLRRLAAAARVDGIDQFVAQTMPQNERMLGVFTRSAFPTVTSYGGGGVEVSMSITAIDRRSRCIGLR